MNLFATDNSTVTKRKRSYPSNVKNQLIGLLGSHCLWCSSELNLDTITVDHVVPVSAGGSDWIGNLIPSCGSCNSQRRSLPASVWLERCLQQGKEVRTAQLKPIIKKSRFEMRCQHYWFRQIKRARAAAQQRQHHSKVIRKARAKSLEYLFAGEQPFDLRGILLSRAFST